MWPTGVRTCCRHKQFVCTLLIYRQRMKVRLEIEWIKVYVQCLQSLPTNQPENCTIWIALR